MFKLARAIPPLLSNTKFVGLSGGSSAISRFDSTSFDFAFEPLDDDVVVVVVVVGVAAAAAGGVAVGKGGAVPSGGCCDTQLVVRGTMPSLLLRCRSSILRAKIELDPMPLHVCFRAVPGLGVAYMSKSGSLHCFCCGVGDIEPIPLIGELDENDGKWCLLAASGLR